MNFSAELSYIAALVTAGVAVLALYRDPRSFVHRIFAIGMGFFAIEAALVGFSFQSPSLEAFMGRQQIRLIVASFLPVLWLFFSLSFARSNYAEFLSKWKWILILFFIAPLAMVTVFRGIFYAGIPLMNAAGFLLTPVGWSGYFWYLFWIACSVLILMNLERTLRHSTGHKRWQIKFMILGVGSIFGIHIFTDSQVILFRGVSTSLDIVNAGALLVGTILISRSLFRGSALSVGLHLSHQFLYSSFTVLAVGIYFIVVGLVAWFSLQFGGVYNIQLAIFLVFVAVVGLATFLLSDRLRLARKRLISRHLKRPMYNYQNIWEDFTARTATITRTENLCNAVVKMVSETLEILSVSIWLVDEKREQLTFGGSTVFTPEQAVQLKFYGYQGVDLIRAMSDQAMPVDLEGKSDDWVEDLRLSYVGETKEALIRYCVPLRTAEQLVGIMTLSEKILYESLTFEDSDLLKTIADQAAASLLNIRLSEYLRQVKELEAFQTMSAFFMHDLKNLASKLSLVTQNLPVHLDNPEFRSDALKTISQSVAKINTMSGRLSLLSQKLELNPQAADLNELVKSTLADMHSYIKGTVSLDLNALPPASIDREQIHKVIENFVMNANDALDGPGGTIVITTRENEPFIELSFSDNGCGMSKEFVEKHLFRPFQTTKKQGMGIGLFHCKTIVEAHGGRIEVDSVEGKGTIFRILLPVAR
jgi:putative PEP-CTERM system histidine kinase